MKATLPPLTVFVVLCSGMAQATDPPPPAGPRVACRADVEKFCPGVEPGGGRIAACLKQNAAQISAACKDAIAKQREKRAPGMPPSPQG